MKRDPTTGRTRRSRSLVKTPDLRLTVKENKKTRKIAFKARHYSHSSIHTCCINLHLLQYMYVQVKCQPSTSLIVGCRLKRGKDGGLGGNGGDPDKVPNIGGLSLMLDT